MARARFSHSSMGNIIEIDPPVNPGLPGNRNNETLRDAFPELELKIGKIFISIASYRDKECKKTIVDLFEKADGIGYRSGNFFYSRRIGQDINFDEDDYLNENK